MCGWSCLQGLSLCEVGLKPLLDKGGLPSPPATLLEVISALSQGPKMALSQRGLIAPVSPFFCLTHLCSGCSISPTISRQDCSVGGWGSLSPAWNSDKGKVVKEYQGRSWYTESGPNLQVCSWYHGWKCHKRVFTIYCALIWLAGGGDGISGGPSPMSAALRGPCSFQAPTGLVVQILLSGCSVRGRQLFEELIQGEMLRIYGYNIGLPFLHSLYDVSSSSTMFSWMISRPASIQHYKF